MQKHVFRVIPGLFGNISKSGNIWGRDFYRNWMVKLTLPALAHAQFMSLPSKYGKNSHPKYWILYYIIYIDMYIILPLYKVSYAT